jgi:hypothetical protein
MRVRAAALAAENDSLRARAADLAERADGATSTLQEVRAGGVAAATRDAAAAAAREARLSSQVDRQRRALAELGDAAAALAAENGDLRQDLARALGAGRADAQARAALEARTAHLQELVLRAQHAPPGPSPACSGVPLLCGVGLAPSGAASRDAATAAAMLALIPSVSGAGGVDGPPASHLSAAVAAFQEEGGGGGGEAAAFPRNAWALVDSLTHDRAALEASVRGLEARLAEAEAAARAARGRAATDRWSAADTGGRATAALAAAARKAALQAAALEERDRALGAAKAYAARLEARLVGQHRALAGVRAAGLMPADRRPAGVPAPPPLPRTPLAAVAPASPPHPPPPPTAGRAAALLEDASEAEAVETPSLSGAAFADSMDALEAPASSSGAAFADSMDALEARLAGLARDLEATPHTRAAIVAGVVPARGEGGGAAARALHFSGATPGGGRL